MRKKVFLLSISFFLLLYFIFGLLVKQNAFYSPNVDAIDLSTILTKEQLVEEDYTILLQQTGLSKPIIDTLKTMPDFLSKMKSFQDNYLKEVQITAEKMNPLTRSDAVLGEDGSMQKLFEIAPYENGYIFLTKSTHTLNWRHGHAAIVIDAKRGKTLEALEPGTVSMEQDASKWEYYPTFKMLRLKDVSQEKMDEIAAYATTELVDLPYNILAPKKIDKPTSTECSLLVWQAFKPFGFDIDKNGGIFVSPQDIAASSLLEVLQIYGFNPKKDW